MCNLHISQQDYKPMNHNFIPPHSLLRCLMLRKLHEHQDDRANGVIVEDVVEITHSIRLAVLKPLPWEVWGEGENGFEQLIDSYSTFKEAQTDYPNAFSSWKETEFEDCVEYDF